MDGLEGVPGNNAVNLSRMFMGRGQLVLGQKTVPGKGFDGSSSFKGLILESHDDHTGA